jgi:hypothetical protein
MDHGGVDRDRQIGERGDSGGVGHVRQLLGDVRYPGVTREHRAIIATQVALDADERNAVERKQRFKEPEVDGTVSVVRMAGMAGPGERHAFSGKRLDARPPLRDPVMVGPQIGNLRRDR